MSQNFRLRKFPTANIRLLPIRKPAPRLAFDRSVCRSPKIRVMMALPKTNGEQKPTQSEVKLSVTENVTERKYIMTNNTYKNITVVETPYLRSDKPVLAIEFKLNVRLEHDSFLKLVGNLKAANKGSQVKLYYTKSIFEYDKDGNFIPDEKRRGYNKSHTGFLCDSGENFDKPAIIEALEAFDKVFGEAVKTGIYKAKERKLTLKEAAEEIARLKNLLDSKGVAY